MFDAWNRLTEALHPLRSEATLHGHVPEEQADLFRSLDGGTTEADYLTLLYGLVRAWKPLNVLETGTNLGWGTVTLAAACEDNGRGTVTTVDRDACHASKHLADRLKLAWRIRWEHSTSLAYLLSYDGPPFDFCFFDSDLGIRVAECKTLVERGKVHGLVAFHDTSRLRGQSPTAPDDARYVPALDDFLKGGVEFPLSRGLRMAVIP